MNLTKNEIRVIIALAQGGQQPVSEIARALKVAVPLASRTVSSLSIKGIIEKRRKGMTVIISLTRYKLSRALCNLLIGYPHIPWKRVLSNSRLSLLQGLDGGTDILHLCKDTHVPPPTAYRNMAYLSSVGMVTKEGSVFHLNKNHAAYIDLKVLFDAMDEHENDAHLDIVLQPNSAILWQKGDEYQVKSNDMTRYLAKIKENGLFYALTSVSALERYGAGVFKIYDVVYVSFINTEILVRAKDHIASKEDVILHLLMDGDSRHREFASGLVKKYKKTLDLSYLKRKAKELRIVQVTEQILEKTAS